MFAALNTVEPPILDLATARLLEGDKPWAAERLPLVEDRIRDRLAQLSARLGDADWLDGAFSAGDLMMVSVLLRLRASGLLDEYPNLAAYVARGEARPAYQRAFAAQLAVNAGPPTKRLTEALGAEASAASLLVIQLLVDLGQQVGALGGGAAQARGERGGEEVQRRKDRRVRGADLRGRAVAQ